MYTTQASLNKCTTPRNVQGRIMTIAYYDLESEAIDNLEGQRAIKTIHAIGVAVDDGPVQVFTSMPTSYSDGSIQDGVHLLNTCDINLGHNSIGFDLPVLEQVYDIPLTATQLDTMILAKLTYTKDALYSIDYSLDWQSNPTLKKLMGSYSLGAFGVRLGNEKIDFDDWSQLTEKMCTYMQQDVIVTRDLYKVLIAQDTYPAQAVIDLEMEVAGIVQQISTSGFYVDRPAAEALRDSLMYEQFTIKKELLAKYKPLYIPKVVEPPHTTVPAKSRKLRTWVHNPYFKGYWYWNGPTTLTNQLVKQPDNNDKDRQ